MPIEQSRAEQIINMAASYSYASLSTLALSIIFKPKSPSLPAVNVRCSSTFQSHFPTLAEPARARTSQSFKISASNGVFLLSEASAVENSQELVVPTPSEDGVSTIISALLFTAFIGLSILTIGVLYLAVTDLLQKREGEKFAKQEAAKKKKKSGKKARVRAAGPRGFGQKMEEDQDEEAE